MCSLWQIVQEFDDIPRDCMHRQQHIIDRQGLGEYVLVQPLTVRTQCADTSLCLPCHLELLNT